MKIPMYALPHRVTIIPFKGSGAYGPIYETDETKYKNNVPCRIDPKTQRIRSTNGVDVVQRAEGMFHPDWKIKAGDKVTWSLTGMEYTVEDIAPIDAMGLHHYEVVLV